jgi:hypothetical protein
MEEETETNGSQKRAEIIGRRTTSRKAGYIGQLSKIEDVKQGQTQKKNRKINLCNNKRGRKNPKLWLPLQMNHSRKVTAMSVIRIRTMMIAIMMIIIIMTTAGAAATNNKKIIRFAG